MLGVLAIGAAMAFTQWRTGSYNEYKDQVQNLRDELATERKGREDDRHNLKNEIQALALQLEHMKGADAEKDKKIKEFTEIFQGKNPDQVKYMQETMAFNSKLADYMDQSTKALQDLNESHKEQSAIIHELYQQLVVKSKEVKALNKKV